MNEATTTVVPAPQEIKLSEKNIQNYWRKVDKNGPTMPHMETPCWAWTAGKGSSGYGRVRVGGRLAGRPLYSHRIAWTLANGQIPHDGSAHGICVCHRCDNRACVNPAHLFLGDHETNMRDMKSKGRHGTITKPGRLACGDKHYSRTHPEKVRGEANNRSKLTNAIVIAIRTRYAAGGITKTALAVEFGISITHVCDIIRRKTWCHII
jgi:hypothetical protein